jgi:uncharacterized protein
MTPEVMATLIEKAFEYATDQITFAFQGGEPTLIGLEYYKNFVIEVAKANRHNIKVSYALQSNGIHIDEAMALFFAKEKFLLGISLDGPKELHDMNRKDADGKGTYKEVHKTIELLKKHSVEFNILTVINKGVAKHPEKVLNYFKKEGFSYLQFIPCLDKLGETGNSNPFALTPGDYETFLCRLFDLWYKDIVAGVGYSIRMFDNIVQMLLGYPPESCDMTGSCSTNLVIESDGSVYPCDFFVLDEWRLGSVTTDILEDMIQGTKAEEFIMTSRDKDTACATCDYYGICRGGCRRHRAPDSTSPIELNYYCSTYKAFYTYTLERFKHIARLVSQR